MSVCDIQDNLSAKSLRIYDTIIKLTHVFAINLLEDKRTFHRVHSTTRLSYNKELFNFGKVCNNLVKH